MVRLRWIAALSGVYDVTAGALLLAARPLVERALDLPQSPAPIHAELNGLFLIAVGLGYVVPYRDPERGRAYLWLMGPLLKGAGAAAFLFNYFTRPSPGSFLLFAAGDAAVALVTVWALTAPSSTNKQAHPAR